MADQSTLGGAPYGDEFRTVTIRTKDGGLKDVRGVPKSVPDSAVEQKYGGRAIGPVGDAIESAISGVPFGISQLLSLPGKMNVGLGHLLGLRSPEDSKRLAREVQSFDENITHKLGGDYAPRTTTGQYLKSGMAAALPLPGTASQKLQAGLGFASGVLGQGASDAGLGTPGIFAASLAPFLGASAVSASRPRSSPERMRNALESMSPEDTSTMTTRLQVAKENNLPVMPWQMAPEGSELRQLGQAVAGQEQAYGMRRLMSGQSRDITSTADLAPELRKPTASSRISGPLYEESAKVPLKYETAKNIKDAILAIKKDKNLAPNSPQAKVIDKIADQIGETNAVSDTQRIDQLAQQANQYSPGSPEYAAIRKQVSDLFSGKASAESQFTPALSNYGELQNIYQNVKVPDGLGGLDVDKATKAWVRQAIAKVADVDNPLFRQARDKYAKVKDVESAVLDSIIKRHSVNTSATTETLPELLYAGATTPLWAAVPMVRSIGKKKLVQDYEKSLMSTDPASLARLAGRKPIGDAVEFMRMGLLSPVKQGEVDISTLMEERNK